MITEEKLQEIEAVLAPSYPLSNEEILNWLYQDVPELIAEIRLLREKVDGNSNRVGIQADSIQAD